MPVLKQANKKKSALNEVELSIFKNGSDREEGSVEPLGGLPIMNPKSHVLKPLFHFDEGSLQKKFFQRWYLNLWHKKIKNNTEASYKGLRYGEVWRKIDPNFDRKKLSSLSKDNVHNLEDNVYQFANEVGFETSVVDEFIANFSRLDFILGHFTKKSNYFSSLKSRTLIEGEDQATLINSLATKDNTTIGDFARLSNNEFVFFKFQINPKNYPSLHYHRSRFGSNVYVFSLHSTNLLRFGHVYTLDPLLLDDDENEMELSIFQNADLVGIQSNKHKIREVEFEDKFRYPLTKKERELKIRENIFYGPLILKGLALYVLSEAYHMHPEIFMKFISNRNTLENEKMIHLLDIFLSRALKIQALIPREIGTAFSEFGCVKPGDSSLNKISDSK